MSAAPYPFSSLESMTRADVETLRALRRFGHARVRLDRIASGLSELAKARVEVFLRRVRRVTADRGADDAVGVLVAIDGEKNLERAALIEAEGALAAALVARALGRSPPRITGPDAALNPALGGALGAIFISAARRAHGGAAFRVLAAGPAYALANDLRRRTPNAVAATLTVLFDDDAYHAEVTLSANVAALAPAPAWDLEALLGLGPLPLALSIVAAAATCPGSELLALSPGDVFLPGAWPLSRAPSGSLVGQVLVAPPRAERAIVAELCENGQIVVGGQVQGLPWSPASEGVAMTDTGAAIDVLSDVPVVVRVEIGTAELPASEWAGLAKGDVIALGRKLADPVALRVAGVLVARGELVQIEGEVGVRIVERLGGVS